MNVDVFRLRIQFQRLIQIQINMDYIRLFHFMILLVLFSVCLIQLSLAG